MSRMSRRTVPSRKVRPNTRVSRLGSHSLVVIINMSDNGERWMGRRVRGLFPRFAGRTYFWSFPHGTFDEFRRGPSWLAPRTRGW